VKVTRAAELTADTRNALKSEDFAVPGKRKLPIHDEGHVRAAMGRLAGTKGLTDSERATAKTRIKAAAKKHGIEVSDDFAEYAIYGEPLLVACGEHEVIAADLREGKPLPLVKVGEHDFRDSYGLVAVTPTDLDNMVTGFAKNARRQDLPLLNEEHIPAVYSDEGDVLMGPGAIGWIKEVYRDGDTLYGVPDWNPAGERLLADDRYRAVSPELLLDWTDPETGEPWGMTLAGAALTTMPKMKALAHQGSPLGAGEARVLAFAERRFADAAPAGHGPFTGSHSHSHPAMGAQGGDDSHTHKHAHKNDGDHGHGHDMGEDVHVDRFMPGVSIAYAYPGKQRLPLHTAEAVKGARARFLTVEAAEAERDEAWGRLSAAAAEHGVPVPGDWRELKASESVQLLMQEGDLDDDTAEDVAAGMFPPCSYQPPYGCCPGYTRADPDGDGDADCCAMANATPRCNGYVPLVSRASFVSPQAGITSYYGERTGGPPAVSGTRTTTTKDGTRVAGAADPAAAPPAAVTAAEPGVTPPPTATAPAAAQAKPGTAGAGSGGQGTTTPPAAPRDGQGTQATGADDDLQVADFAELRTVLAAERRQRLAAEQIAKDALKAAEDARNQVTAIQTASKLSETAGRLEALVRTGRITPAEKELYGERIADFAENDWLITALEQRPEGKAVDMGEKGSGETGPIAQSRGVEIDRGARALMAERKQSTDLRDKDFARNYREAAGDFAAQLANGAGYRG
jgi:hypothetical protein